MVKSWMAAMAILMTGGPAGAQPDWRGSGGAIFAGLESQPPYAEADALAPRLPPRSQPHDAAVTEAANRRNIDPKLLHALIAVESSYQVRAVSPAGAGGLTQLMPATARALGVADRFNPEANVTGGADYLAQQLLRFGDVRLALAAYNAGPERVARLGRVPDIAETQVYVSAVVDCFLALTAGRPVRNRSDCRRAGP